MYGKRCAPNGSFFWPGQVAKALGNHPTSAAGESTAVGIIELRVACPVGSAPAIADFYITLVRPRCTHAAGGVRQQ